MASSLAAKRSIGDLVRNPTFLIALWIVILYVGTVPLRFPGNFDALNERSIVDGEGDQARIQHLFLTPLFRTFDRALPFLPRTVRLGAVNLILGLGSLWLVYLMVIRLGGGRGPAAVAVAVTAFSWVHWEHSIEAESAMVGEFLFLAGLYSIYPCFVGAPGENRSFLSGGICVFLGTLFTLNVGFYLPLVLLWILSCETVPLKSRLVRTVLFGAPAALGWGVLTTLSAIQTGALVGLFGFPDYSGSLDLGWRLDAAKFFRSGSGLLNGFILSDFGTLYRFHLLSVGVPDFPREFSRFLVAAVPSILLALGALIMTIRTRRRLGSFLVAVMIVTGAFGYLWLGSDPQFWLSVVDLAPLGFAGLFSALPQVGRKVFLGFMFLLSVVLCGVNYKGRTPCLLSPNGGANWQTAKEMSERIPDSLPFVSFARGPGDYMQYFLGERGRIVVFGVDTARSLKDLTGLGTLPAVEILRRNPIAFLLPTGVLECERLDRTFVSAGLPGLRGDLGLAAGELGYDVTKHGAVNLYIPPISQEGPPREQEDTSPMALSGDWVGFAQCV